MDAIHRENAGRPNGEVPQILGAPREFLSELGRATTAYYEATPDRLEQARQEYEEALRKFNAQARLPRQ